MSAIQQIKSRIKSVQSTIKVTKVMQLIAASKFRGMRSFMLSLEKYHQNSKLFTSELFNNLSLNNPNLLSEATARYPILSEPDGSSTSQLIIIIGSNRGLCGPLNSASLKKLLNDLGYQKDTKTKILCVGNNVYNFLSAWLRKNSLNIEITPIIHPDADAQINDTAQKLALSILKEMNRFEKIEAYYTHFFSALRQESKKHSISLAGNLLSKDKPTSPNYLIEGKTEDVCAKAIEKFILSQCQYLLRHTLISEQAMRMNIMDSATNNGNKVIKKLLLRYNKVRQASITNELIDIISAANAVK